MKLEYFIDLYDKWWQIIFPASQLKIKDKQPLSIREIGISFQECSLE